MSRGWTVLAVGVLLASGCDDDDGGVSMLSDAERFDRGTADAGAVDAGPADDTERALAFCDDWAEARCAWAHGCLAGAQSIRSELGLTGGSEADCIAGEAELCKADVTDRAARGTLAYDRVVASDCVDKVSGFACPMNPPVEWALDWRNFVNTRCFGAVAGTVVSGEACTASTDCMLREDLCLEGQCRQAERADIASACDPTGNSLGALNADADCTGGVCAFMGASDDRPDGLCSIDCRDGEGACPNGSACLSLSVLGAAPNWFCVVQCTNDGECAGGECAVEIPGVASNQKYCTDG